MQEGLEESHSVQAVKEPPLLKNDPPLPLHARVSNDLRADIAQGVLTGPLPTEQELVERFGVSRSVVRQALGTLMQEGLISKQRGRGSFVNPVSRFHRVVQTMNGLGTQLEGTGEAVKTRVLEYETGPLSTPPRGWQGGDALRLVRLRSVNDEPVAVIETYIPAEATGLISADDLESASLHALLADRLGLELACSKRTVVAVPARAQVADALRIAIGSPVLLLSGTTYDARGVPVELFTTHHRGDRIAFDVSSCSAGACTNFEQSDG